MSHFCKIVKEKSVNRKLITTTQELIQNRLGADGYAFAKVDPVPTPNNETNEVSLTFFVDPGNRVYVRNIGSGPAADLAAAVSGDGYSLQPAGDSGCGTTLASGASCDLVIRFTPAGTGERTTLTWSIPSTDISESQRPGSRSMSGRSAARTSGEVRIKGAGTLWTAAFRLATTTL